MSTGHNFNIWPVYNIIHLFTKSIFSTKWLIGNVELLWFKPIWNITLLSANISSLLHLTLFGAGGGEVRSDLHFFGRRLLKNGLFDSSEIFCRFLNDNLSVLCFQNLSFCPPPPRLHRLFGGYFSPQHIRGGGVRSNPPNLESSVFIQNGTVLGQNNSKFNFHQLLFS